jgi:hypothetical protein
MSREQLAFRANCNAGKGYLPPDRMLAGQCIGERFRRRGGRFTWRAEFYPVPRPAQQTLRSGKPGLRLEPLYSRFGLRVGGVGIQNLLIFLQGLILSSVSFQQRCERKVRGAVIREAGDHPSE